MSNTNDPERFPLLDSVLKARGLQRQAIYTIQTTAPVFGVSSRTIEDWCTQGKLIPRDLPGRGRFLPVDLEELLQHSKRRRKKREDDDHDSDGSVGNSGCRKRR